MTALGYSDWPPLERKKPQDISLKSTCALQQKVKNTKAAANAFRTEGHVGGVGSRFPLVCSVEGAGAAGQARAQVSVSSETPPRTTAGVSPHVARSQPARRQQRTVD